MSDLHCWVKAEDSYFRYPKGNEPAQRKRCAYIVADRGTARIVCYMDLIENSISISQMLFNKFLEPEFRV